MGLEIEDQQQWLTTAAKEANAGQLIDPTFMESNSLHSKKATLVLVKGELFLYSSIFSIACLLHLSVDNVSIKRFSPHNILFYFSSLLPIFYNLSNPSPSLA